MSINNFLIKIFNEYVGIDEFGNRYYVSKNKRQVIYKGMTEPSKVPPMWHAWLHHLSDKVPTLDDLESHNWQQSHSPNITGTNDAYHPTRKIVSSDYHPWEPK